MFQTVSINDKRNEFKRIYFSWDTSFGQLNKKKIVSYMFILHS